MYSLLKRRRPARRAPCRRAPCRPDFLADRRSSFLGVWAAPGGREAFLKDGALRPPSFWKVSRLPEAEVDGGAAANQAQVPTITKPLTFANAPQLVYEFAPRGTPPAPPFWPGLCYAGFVAQAVSAKTSQDFVKQGLVALWVLYSPWGLNNSTLKFVWWVFRGQTNSRGIYLGHTQDMPRTHPGHSFVGWGRRFVGGEVVVVGAGRGVRSGGLLGPEAQKGARPGS